MNQPVSADTSGIDGKPRGRWAWALYDWANSAFATTVIAGFFPVFFKTWWSAGQSDATSTFHLGVGSSVASLIVLVLAPIFGAIAGRRHRKKLMLSQATALGVLATAALFFVGEGGWLMALSLFVLASIAYNLAIVFYDSLIVDVAPAADCDRISALGYAFGYLGGGVLLAVNVWMTLSPETFGLPSPAAAVRWSFLTVAVWWAVFTLPLLVRVRESGSHNAPTATHAVKASLIQLAHTFRRIRGQRQILLFLIAYWLYIDGVHTIIRMAVDFGLSIGFDSTSLITALLLVQFVGFPSAIVFGYLGERWDTKKAIYLGLAVYAGVTAWGYFLTYVWQFYVMAAIIGLVQGGVQALSRSYFASLIDADKAGEYFGIYNMMGKFAAVLGPLLVGVTAALTGSARLSILSVLVLFGLGAFVLFRSGSGRASTG